MSLFFRYLPLVSWLACVLAISMCVGTHADEPTKITFEDHIKPIFREHCLSCHNANDKKSGLALDTYTAVMGGGSGGDIVAAGDLDSSRLWALTSHKEQPYMPPMQDKLAQPKLDLLKAWIEQGMPENSGSVVKKPKANVAALGVVTTGRPEGPPPMPVTMLKQSPFYTPRASTISALAASPWSPLVAVGGQQQVSLYHSETGQLVGVIPFPEGEPQSITFSRDGRLILIGGGRHSVAGCAVLHEIASGNRIAKVGDELDIVMAADLSDDNRLIALAGPQKMVRVYETLTGQLKYQQKKHTDWIYAVRFSPDGLLLATADRSAGMVVWETQTGRMYLELPGHKGEIRSIAWRPDSQALVSASLDGTLKMWEMNEGKVIKSWDAHGGGVMSIAICNDGTMASTGKDQKVKVWDAGGNPAGEMPPLVEAGQEVAITVDSKHVAAGDWAGNVRLWLRATPADEKLIPANPPTLEMALASAQQQLGPATAAQQVVQNEVNAAQSQVTAVQKQSNDLQAQIASLTTALQSMTEASVALKAQFDALGLQITAADSELVAKRAGLVEKTNQANVVVAKKKELDDAIGALQAKRASEGADPVAIDAQIADVTKQSQDQATALATLQAEMQSMQVDVDARDKMLAELKTAAVSKNGELAAVLAKIQEVTVAKGTAEQQVEPVMNALKAAVDAAGASQAKLVAATATVTDIQQRIDLLQQDIARFGSVMAEWTAKKVVVEQSIAGTQPQLVAAQSVVAATQQQLDGSANELTKLEQQIATLQALVVAEQAKRKSLQETMSGQQQSVDAVQSQIQQLESDLASIAMQLDLLQKAFAKRE